MTKNSLSMEENNQIKHQIDKWLLPKVENKNQKKPILQLAERVLQNYKKKTGNLNPPINLNDLGECLDIKVKQILLSKNISSSALLIPIDGGFKVELKNEDKLHHNYRTRYSCAHEMAHTFFYKMEDGSVPFRAVPSGSDYEESLCDIAAAELLMPKEVFETASDKIITKYDNSLNALIKLKETFKTSLQSISIKAINNGWEDYLIAKWNPIFDNKTIIRFEKEWEFLKKVKITMPKKVYKTEPIFEIFEEMWNRPGEKISKYNYEKDFYPEGINTKVMLLNDGYLTKLSFLIMVPISEYLKALQYSDLGNKHSKEEILLNFIFEKKNSKRQKLTVTKEKKDLVDFM